MTNINGLNIAKRAGGLSVSGSALLSIEAAIRLISALSGWLVEIEHTDLPRIVARNGNFYLSGTNDIFTPRGNVYARIQNGYHATFLPGVYSATAAEAALTAMKNAQYNTVKVIVSDVGISDPSAANKLSAAYLDNLSGFIGLAAKRGIYVILSLPYIPIGYYPASPCGIADGNFNPHYFCQSFIDAKKLYLQNFIAALNERGTRMDAIFGYDLATELFFSSNHAPLNSTGSVTAPNGITYGLPAERQQMIDASLVYYLNSLVLAVKAADPLRMVGVNFASPWALALVPSGDEARAIRTYWAIADASAGGSSVDYVSLSVYPYDRDGAYNPAVEFASFEIPASHNKPLMVGEFGAYKAKSPTLTGAAAAMRDLQILSCDYGVRGWLYWTWNTAEQPELWYTLEGGGAINGVLSPLNRPNPAE